MSTQPQSILLLGAGELGTSILAALSAHPSLTSTRLTILLRPSTLASPTALPRLTHLRSLAAPPTPLSFVPLDLAAPTARADLAALIRDDAYDAVIACTGFAASGAADEGTQALAAAAVLAARAQGARVRAFVPWQFGVDYDVVGAGAAGGLMAEQVRVREVLRGQEAVRWVIVSTGMFTSFVFEEFFGVVEGLEGEGEVVVRALGSWETKVTVTAVEDIGRVVADVVAVPVERNDRGGSVVFTAGQTLTYGELADVVEKVVGGRRKVRREEWSLQFLQRELEKDPDSQIKKYRVLFGEGKGVSWEMENTINAERGIATVGVEEWLRKKLNA
ncbi:hypothetical protein SLS56_011197 [Neofusicoccum ribis]|uniref:NmrA-like domain-containing protein n=1 Tax=Neofusicoccum ribis TaxID=45134 RepID=A0ABR3SCB8_9PEZI